VGKTVSEHYAAKLAAFQAAQALHKERKAQRRYARQLQYNRRWLRRYKRRLKREAREEFEMVLRVAREILKGSKRYA
jgi:hypothetical protein